MVNDADRRAASVLISGMSDTSRPFHQWASEAFAAHREQARREALEEAARVAECYLVRPDHPLHGKLVPSGAYASTAAAIRALA